MKGGGIYYNFLSLSFGLLEEPSSLGKLELPQQSCSLVLLVMPFKWGGSLLRGGSHQHRAVVVHHHPTIISQWLLQSHTQHGQMDWVLWTKLKSCGYSGMVIHLKTSVALLCHTFSTWNVSLDHERIDLCSSKPLTISLRGQFENSLLFFI